MGHTHTEMVRALGVNISTISRELRRNSGQRGYRPKQAHEKAMERHQQKARPSIRAETRHLIEKKLRLQWSPEQIAGWLKRHNQQAVSHEPIYKSISRG
jgi:IS30 family transposase